RPLVEHEATRALPYGAPTPPRQKAQAFQLLHPPPQPLARPVAAVVGRRERRFQRVLALEQPRRVRHAHDDADAALSRAREEAPPRVLLQQVVNDLQRGHWQRAEHLIALSRAAA